MELAHHENVWLLVPVSFLGGGAIALIALPVAAISIGLGFAFRKPVGPLLALIPVAVLMWVVEYLYHCSSCSDHRFERAAGFWAAVAGALTMGYLLGWIGAHLRERPAPR